MNLFQRNYLAAEGHTNQVLQSNARPGASGKSNLMNRRRLKKPNVSWTRPEMLADPVPLELLAIELDASLQRKSGLGVALALANLPRPPVVLNSNWLPGHEYADTKRRKPCHSLVGQTKPQTYADARADLRRQQSGRALAYLNSAWCRPQFD